MLKKIIIAALSVLIVASIVMLMTIDKKYEEKNIDELGQRTIVQDQIIYISLDALIKLEYQETFKLCPDSVTSSTCSDISTKVVNVELLNDEAKTMYGNVSLRYMDIYSAIYKIINIANNYGITSGDILFGSGNLLTSKIATEDIEINFKFLDSFDRKEIIKNYANRVIITFNTDGGSNIVNKIINKGSILDKPEDPIKEGYTFVEWQLNNETYGFNKPINEDIELIAIWEKNKEYYTVEFDTDGGNNIDSQSVEEGDIVTKPKNPKKKGYKFVMWTLDGEEYDFSEPITNNIVLKALWK